MKTLFPHSSFVLLLTALLAWAVPGPGRAQQRPSVAPRTGSPALTDPTYVARKRQKAGLPAVSSRPPVARAATRGSGTPSAALNLPACFVPLDTTAAGGWSQMSRELGVADDSFVGPIALGFNFSLYGQVYNQVYINSNGNISFGDSFIEYTATGLPTNTPMIAPFWADVDTELDDPSAPYPSGGIWYKVFADRLVVTWNRVGYYERQSDKKNTFQLTIKANTTPGFTGDDVFFAYGDMQWTTGRADEGVNGFGGVAATVGINKGDNATFVQVGRFNQNTSTYVNNVDPSGVNWLDNQCFSFQVGGTSNNIPPTITGLPAGNTITLGQGETRNLALQFLGPEVGQTVAVTSATGGLCNTTVTNNGAANPTLNLSITGAPCNLGTHIIRFTATDNGTPVASQQFELTVVVTSTITWTGAVSTDFNTPGNWSGNAVPTAADDASIPAGVPRMPVLSGTAAVRNLSIAAAANLTVAPNAVFALGGNLANDGLLLGGGTLQTSGGAPQTFAGTGETSINNVTVGAAGVVLNQPLFLDRVLTLNGNLTSNGNLTLHSRFDGSSTAMVVNNGAAAVVGAATVERFIGPTTAPAMGYRHLSAPVTNTTVGDMSISGGFGPVTNPLYNTSPTPGSVTPFPNVFGYDQSRVSTGSSRADFDRGWVSPAAANEALTPGRGYTVNLMGRQVMDFVGTLGNGDLTRSGLTRGAGPQAGWHLLGNPYPAPIDFTLLTRSGLDNAVYVFKSDGQYSGSYAGFVNGVPVNGGSNILPMGQGFFVRASSSGAAGSLTFTNAARLTTYLNPALQRPTAETRPLLRLELRSATAADEVAVYFEPGATAGFDGTHDAYRLGNGNTVQLGALAGGQELSISGLPALTGTAPVTVPLAVRVARPGSFTLRATELLNLPAGWTAALLDAQTGVSTNLALQPSYACTLAANEPAGRFSLRFSPSGALATAPAQLSAQVTVFPNPARGAVSLALPAAPRPVQVSITNALGQQVLTRRVPAGQAVVSLLLTDLAQGVYHVRVTLSEGVVTKRLVVE